MFNIRSFGVRNLRSLRDTGLVEIKPVTVLVGKNSAGKSSFARVLPLLKQSSERRKQAPLLWFGRLVDFGSFDEAVSSFADKSEIQLKLRFACPRALYPARRGYDPRSLSEPHNEDLDVTLELGSEGDDARTVLRQVTLSLYTVEVRLAFGRDVQITVDGTPAHVPADSRIVHLQGAILPIVRKMLRESSSTSTVSDAALFQSNRSEGLGVREVRSAISLFVHGNTLNESKDDIASRLPLASTDELLRHCLRLGSAPDTWRYNMSVLANNDGAANLKSLQRALVLFHLESLLVELDESIQAFCNGVSYLEPLRATAQRYYRREEISIDELDPKGINTAFFIQGLSLRDRESLNRWLAETFGFTLSVSTAGGHSSLNITVENGPSRNMADVGLGYSQVAPVAVQLWHASRASIRSPLRARLQRREIKTVVIEQPELHLHPAYQAKLADVFVSCVKLGDGESKAPKIHLMAETHSPNLINRLGELVSTGDLDRNDVQVLVFETDPAQEGAASIRVATFDDEGILRNWPVGFFDY